jgi:dTDP-L-rhamnose 4-epimerase
MRLLVTGGAGFIGSHVVDMMVGHGHDVVVLDALLPSAHSGPPQYLRPEVRYRWGDLRDRDLVEACLHGVDAVCHQAAMVGLGVDFGDVAAYVAHNDAGTAALLDVLHRRRFTGRLVIASSMVVYGEGRYRCPYDGVVRPPSRRIEDLERGVWEPRCPRCRSMLQAEPVDEAAPVDPRNVYAATKLHQEHLAACFAREHPTVDVVALRYHNVYGPRMPFGTPYAGVAAIFRSALEAGQRPQVFEDGGQLRDFVHVTDVATANRLALDGGDPSSGFTVFNVASGHPRTVGEMAAALCDAYGDGTLRPEIVPRFRPGDVRHVMGSATRATTELGFRAAVPFAEGMQDFAVSSTRG